MSNPQPKMAMNVAQHTIVNLLKIFVLADQFSLVFVYVMCGPRHFFFFQCGWPRDMKRVDTPGGRYNQNVLSEEAGGGQRKICSSCLLLEPMGHTSKDNPVNVTFWLKNKL